MWNNMLYQFMSTIILTRIYVHSKYYSYLSSKAYLKFLNFLLGLILISHLLSNRSRHCREWKINAPDAA